MPSVLRNIIFLLTINGWRNVLLLLAGMVVVALFEVIGVASIMPFIGVASRPEMIADQPLLHTLYVFSGATSSIHFLILLGISMITLLITTNATAALVNWSLLTFTYRRGHELSQMLFAKYMAQPYQYFLTHNTSLMHKMILVQVHHVVTGVLIPSLQMVSRSLALLFLLGLLITINPRVTLVILCVVGSFYTVLFFALRRTITRAGQQAIKADNQRHTLITEVLSAIKEVKLSGRESFFLDRFSIPSLLAAQRRSSSETVSLLPRYLLETLAFGAMVAIIIYMLAQQGSLATALPVLALYALVGYRMMPALQQVFYSIALMRFHGSAMTELCHVLHAQDVPKQTILPTGHTVTLKQHIALHNISFAYPNESASALREISLLIPAHRVTALVGATGSGKSTLADVITGILTAQSGQIMMDDMPLTAGNIRAWQNGIGYVPQHIFLLDDTVRRNIAFGIADDKIDEVAVARAAQMAQIDGFINNELKDGYDTVVGERGIRLSGGQRQRIGLARALYHNPQLLVLDEATSALDNVTERSVMEAIHALGGSKTVVVIAHRLSTVQQCDQIVLLEHGRVTAQGTYEELLKTSGIFQKLAQAIEESDDAAESR